MNIEHEPSKRTDDMKDFDGYPSRRRITKEEKALLKKRDQTTLQNMYYITFMGFRHRLELTAHELNLTCFIWTFQQKRGWCYASQHLMAEGLGVSETTINTTLKKLEKRGFLEKAPHKSFLTTTQWRLGKKAQDAVEDIQSHIKHKKEMNEVFKAAANEW